MAITVQIPVPINEILPELMLQTPAEAGSMEKITGKPEDAVAAGVYVVPPTVALLGGVLVNVMVWLC